MAMVYITLKLMPEDADSNLVEIAEKARIIVSEFEGNIMEVKEEPVAFGVKSVNITFSRDENKGTSDDIEEALSKLDGVMSVNVADVRRGLG